MLEVYFGSDSCSMETGRFANLKHLERVTYKLDRATYNCQCNTGWILTNAISASFVDADHGSVIKAISNNVPVAQLRS